MKIAIIAGITGQNGAYLAKLLLSKNYKVIGLLRDKNSATFDKLNYLNMFGISNILPFTKKYIFYPVSPYSTSKASVH